MKKIQFLALIAIFLMLVSCQVQIPMNTAYLQKSSRVGLYVNVNNPQWFREGSQGWLDQAITSGDKYTPLLDLAKTNLDPKQELITMYTDLLKAKGKEVI